MTSGEHRQRRWRHCNSGYAYLMLLGLVAGITTVAAYSLELGSSSQRRDAESELLRVGYEFEKALMAYTASVAQSPPIASGPTSLEQLLRDNRQPHTLRHLRKLYSDPMTGTTKWGTVLSPSGSIWGVYSLAEGKPLKQEKFPPQFSHLERADRFSDWVFGLPQARNQRQTQVSQPMQNTPSPSLSARTTP